MKLLKVELLNDGSEKRDDRALSVTLSIRAQDFSALQAAEGFYSRILWESVFGVKP